MDPERGQLVVSYGHFKKGFTGFAVIAPFMPSNEPISGSGRPFAAVAPKHPALKEVSDRVVRYFREFIESDFRKAQAPRRRIQLKNQAGFRCGIDLRKYPALFKDAWGLTAKSPSEMVLSIRRRKYRADVSPVLKNLVEQHVGGLGEDLFKKIREAVISQARLARHRFASDPDMYLESVMTDLQQQAAVSVVRPLLALVEGAFADPAMAQGVSVFDMEAELVQGLCASCAPHLGQALNTLMLQGEEQALRAVLEEFFCSASAQLRLTGFFESFAASDVLQELRDLVNFAQSDDSLTLYIYFGAVRIGSNDHPLFHLPIQLRPQEDDSGHDLVIEPKLYVNKQALDHVANEIRQSVERVSTATVTDRIVHLNQVNSLEKPASAQEHMERIRLELARTFDALAELDFCQAKPQTARAGELRFSNAVHLAVFDRSDDSLVSDYEAMLSSAQADHEAAAVSFTDMIGSMLFEEPVSVSEAVRQDWAGTEPSHRLVPDSPIPLNEEQIRIDIARKKGARFIAVSGPPGSGKSHTITALAFNAIMDRQSVLIVSDKNEALDVVQFKLTEALQSIRHGEDFPNPILRLGKDSTYRGLISSSSRVKIESHHQAQSAHLPQLEEELQKKSLDLRERVEATVKTLSSVSMPAIEKAMHWRSQIVVCIDGGDFFMDVFEGLCLDGVEAHDRRASVFRQAFQAIDPVKRAALVSAMAPSKTLGGLLVNLRASSLCRQMSNNLTAEHRAIMALFKPMKASQSDAIMAMVARIQDLKRPLVGLLFRGKEIAAIESEMSREFGCAPTGMAQKITELTVMASILNEIGRSGRQLGVPDEHTANVCAMLTKGGRGHEGALETIPLLVAVHQLLKDTEVERVFEGVQPGRLLEAIFFMGEYACAAHAIAQSFKRVPRVDFVSEKAEIERMHTARLAHRLDSRFLHFVEHHRATAQALGGVIRARAQFPTDQFDSLRDAFPCAIAGIRELGEFVPLKTGLFDLVIIDEGSQVSIAQALPVMLRARQVIVFGDRKQFSNVKSHNASNATNASYLSDLQNHFRQNISAAVDKLERLQRLDVKRSVLDFVELVAGHTEMLRKHFRGYPELISYSNRHFYDGALQAIKVRAKPISEVIRFEIVESLGDDFIERTGSAESRNVNEAEGARVIALLEEMLEQTPRPSVGIITPFTEQAVHLSGLVSRHPDVHRFERELRIKVMTADSCQGEERDVIVFSMVATRERDALNYVFPVEFKRDQDENDTLKAQRLNVAFSRAKECMIFILSKRPEEFVGTLGQALLHYQRILNDRSVSDVSEVDPSSPMEAKVLHWIQQTRFMQDERDRIELIAQFPVGDYLRQMDPSYKHPRYKVDFLFRHRGDRGKITQIIIEYDGFKEHFIDLPRVHAANFESYYKPQDVERQYVLESYGLRFLRINRFNLGKDPVATLDARLRELMALEPSNTDLPEIGAIDLVREQARDLENKDAKTCPKCEMVKEKQAFFDPTLGRGAGGYGRMCMVCKRSSWSGTRRPV
jgi:hypothetical protein